MGLVIIKSHNPAKVIINHSSNQLSDVEKAILAKGLNFALPPKKLNYADYVKPNKILFRDIKELSVDDNILQRGKVDMKKICFPHLKTLSLKMN